MKELYTIVQYIVKVDKKELSVKLSFRYKLLCTNWKQSDFTEEELNYHGYLDLRNTGITRLPDNLTISGALNLNDTPITSLPKNLKVENGLGLEGTNISKIPCDLQIGGHIYYGDIDDYSRAMIQKRNPKFARKITY